MSSLTPSISNRVSLKNLAQSQINGPVSLKSVFQGSYNTNNTYFDPYFSAVALLCHFDGTSGSSSIVDSSYIPKTINNPGSYQIVSTQKVFGTTSLICNNTNSIRADGFLFSSSDFSIEFWLYPTIINTAQIIISNNTATSIVTNLWQISLDATNKIIFTFYTSSIITLQAPTVLSQNTWYNVSICRNGTTCYISINGVAQTLTSSSIPGSIDNATGYTVTGTSSGSLLNIASTTGLIVNMQIQFTTTAPAPLLINTSYTITALTSTTVTLNTSPNASLTGSFPIVIVKTPVYVGRTFTGYIDELRITLGYARYITGFTLSNIPFPDKSTDYDPFFGSVSLLLKCETMIDSSTYNYTLTGTPTFTANIGGNSTKALNISSASGFIKTFSVISFGVQSFTIEFNIYIPNGNTQQATPFIIGNTVSGLYGLNNWYISLASSKIAFNINNNSSSALLTQTSTLTTNVWHHVAIVRNGNTVSLFINGLLDSSVAYSGSLDGGIKNIISVGSDGTWFFTGYLDNIRITNNVARYTRTFPQPTNLPSNVAISSLKGNANMYSPLLYIDANDSAVTETSIPDRSGNANNLVTTMNSVVLSNGLKTFNFNTSAATSTGIPLTLARVNQGMTFIAFTAPQVYQSLNRVLYANTSYPAVGMSYANSNLSVITTATTFNPFFNTNFLGSSYNMLVVRNTQFKFNNQSSNNYINISQTLPTTINSIGGFGNAQYWGNIGAVLAYNTVLPDAQINEIYNRFANRFIYNMPPLDSITVSFNVISVVGPVITLVSTVALNLLVGQLVKFANIPANAGISPYLSYYIKQIISSTPDTNDSAIIYTKIKVSLTSSGSEVVFPHAFTMASITGATTFTVTNATGLGLFSSLQMAINSPTTNALTSGTNYTITAISGTTVTLSATSMTNIAACAIPFTITSGSVVGANYVVSATKITPSVIITVNTALGLSNTMIVEYLGNQYTISSITGNDLTVTGTGLSAATGLSTPLYIVTNAYTTMTVKNTYSITDTYTGVNVFKVASTSGLAPGLRVKFTGIVPTNLNINTTTVYYILSVPDSTSFTLSTSLNGQVLSITNNTAITGLSLTVDTTYTILSANSIGNLFYAASVNYLATGATVQFSTTIGGVNTATTYTVNTVNITTNSFTISLGTTPTTGSACITMTLNGLLSYYSGDSFDGAGVWNDIISGNNISLGTGTLKLYTAAKKDSTGVSIQGLNYYTYLGGTVTSRITFPQLISTTGYTVVWVARYAGVTVNVASQDVNTDTGTGSSKYIFTNITDASATGDYTTAYKWISGFNSGTSGVTVHNNWSAGGSSLGNNWIIGVDQNNLFRANGVTLSSSGSVPSGIFKIGINDAASANTSDFMIATVMIFNYTIPLSNILLLENWLAIRYGITLRTHILDGLSAKGAYGVFRMSSTYTGPTLKIRRSTDNAILDFYADINGNLGSALNSTGQSLGSWIGTANAFIDTWYDQSGSGNHATQTTTGNQPIYDLVNGYINFIDSNNVSKYMALPDGTVPSANTSYTVTIRYNTVNSTVNSVATFLSSGTTGSLAGNSFAVTRSAATTGGNYNNYWTNSTTNSYTYTDSGINVNPNTVSFRYSGTENRIHVNNTTISPSGTTIGTRVSTTRNNYIGVNNAGNGDYFNGQLYYLCIFNSVLSDTDRSKVEMASLIPAQVTGFTAYSIGYTNVKLQWDAPRMPTAYVKITWVATDGSGSTDTNASSYLPNIYGNIYDTVDSSIILNTSAEYRFTVTPYNLAGVAGPVSSITVTTKDPGVVSYATSSTINSFSYTFVPTGGFDSYLLSYYDFTRSIVYQVTGISSSTFTYTNSQSTLLYVNAPVQFYITNTDYTNPIANSVVAYGTTYFIKTVTGNNSFTLSATAGGDQITTFGTVTGTLTLVLSSYNVTASTAGTPGSFTYSNPAASTKLTQWTPVKFSPNISGESLLGGVNTTNVYYINSVTNTTFTLSSTGSPTATNVTTTVGSGNMTLTIQSGNNFTGTSISNAIKSPLNTRQTTYSITSASAGTFTYTNVGSFTYIAVGSGIMFDGAVYTGLNANRMYYVATTPSSTTFTLTGVTGISGSTNMNAYAYTITTPYIITYANNSNNTFRCDSTIGLVTGTPVQFLGGTFGGVASTATNVPRIYYIISANLTATTFSVSDTSGGSAVTVTSTTYGSMYMSIVYQCTGTAVNGNITLNALVTDNLTRLFIGQMVQFSGTLIGGLVANRTYYILSVGNNGTIITVSTTPGGTAVTAPTLTAGTSTGFGMIMTTGYFTTPSSQSLITLDTYNVSIMPYNSNSFDFNKSLKLPILLQIQTAKLYTMPNPSTGFTNINSGNTTAGSLSATIVLSGDQVPNGITWTGNASTGNSPFTSTGSTYTNTGLTPANFKITGLLGNRPHYLQLQAGGFSTAEYTATSYSVISTSTYTSTNATITNIQVPTANITNNSSTVTWTASAFPINTSGLLYITNSSTSSFIYYSLPINNLNSGTASTGSILYGNSNYFATIYYSGIYSSSPIQPSAVSFTTTNATITNVQVPNPTKTNISATITWNTSGFAPNTPSIMYISTTSTYSSSTLLTSNITNINSGSAITNNYLFGNQNYYATLYYQGGSGKFSSTDITTTPLLFTTLNASISTPTVNTITNNSVQVNWTTTGFPNNINIAGSLYITTTTSLTSPAFTSNIPNINRITTINTGPNIFGNTNYYANIYYPSGTYSSVNVNGQTASQFKTLNASITNVTVNPGSLTATVNWITTGFPINTSATLYFSTSTSTANSVVTINLTNINANTYTYSPTSSSGLSAGTLYYAIIVYSGSYSSTTITTTPAQFTTLQSAYISSVSIAQMTSNRVTVTFTGSFLYALVRGNANAPTGYGGSDGTYYTSGYGFLENGAVQSASYYPSGWSKVYVSNSPFDVSQPNIDIVSANAPPFITLPSGVSCDFSWYVAQSSGTGYIVSIFVTTNTTATFNNGNNVSIALYGGGGGGGNNPNGPASGGSGADGGNSGGYYEFTSLINSSWSITIGSEGGGANSGNWNGGAGGTTSIVAGITISANGGNGGGNRSSPFASGGSGVGGGPNGLNGGNGYSPFNDSALGTYGGGGAGDTTNGGGSGTNGGGNPGQNGSYGSGGGGRAWGYGGGSGGSGLVVIRFNDAFTSR